MSSRYQTIAALLGDPVNRAVVQRELVRRQKIGPFKPLLPPSRTKSGGWVILSFRTHLNRHTEQIVGEEEIEALYEIFTDDVAWYVQATEDQVELGPFDTPKRAIEEAKAHATSAGYIVLRKDPWDAEDLGTFPL